MKKLVMIGLCMVMLTTICTGCSSTSTSSGNGGKTQQKKIPDLKGEWKQENSKSNDSYQAATISDDTKTITYEISYEASAMGTTTKIILEKQK